MIGIAGPSGSGKTTIAGKLAESLNGKTVPVISLDAYYRHSLGPETMIGGERNYDDPAAIDQRLMIAQLGQLSHGTPVKIPIYDFSSSTRSARRRPVRPGTHVIVEGLFTLYWTELREMWALSIFVDVDDATGLARRVARDIRERGRTGESVNRQYEAIVRPMYRRYVRPTRRHADLILDGRRPIDETVRRIVERLGSGSGF
jgi:uridine kinase